MNVYDFDNTIYDGESCLDMFFWFMKKDRSLIKFTPKIISAFAKYKKGDITIEKALEEYAPYVERYFGTHPELLADTSEFWDAHMKKIKPFYSKLHRDDDLVISASPESSIREICGRLGISSYIGTSIDPDTGKITRLCMRKNKIKAFFEIYPDEKIESFYTDSEKNDAPLIEIAEHAYIVSGNKIRQVK